MAWLVSKQGVYRPSGHGCPAKYEARQSEAETRAKFDTPGQTSVPAGNKTRQTRKNLMNFQNGLGGGEYILNADCLKTGKIFFTIVSQALDTAYVFMQVFVTPA